MSTSTLPAPPGAATATRTFTILAVVASVFAGTVFAAFPEHRVEFVGEDRSLENLTVGLYGLAVLTAVVAMVRRRFRGVAAAAIVGFAATLGAMEELSWGERYFELEAPMLFGVKIDALHDLLHAAIKRTKVLVTSSSLAQVGVAAVGLTALAVLIRSRQALLRLGRAIAQHPAGKFVLITAALGVFALFLDLVNDVQKNHDLPLQGPVQLGEELCESLAALSLVFAASTQLRTQRPSSAS